MRDTLPQTVCRSLRRIFTRQSLPILKTSPRRRSRQHKTFSTASRMLGQFLLVLANISAVMQQAISRANAPHPELQAELQQEYARIVPKVERSEAENSDPPASKGQVNGHGQATGTRLRRQVSARSDSSNISPRATRHQEGLRRVSDPESLERLIDGMAERQAALALLSLMEQHSSERDGNTSPNLAEKPRRSLSDTTDFPLGNGGHHTELSRADNHAPTNIDNGGLGKMPGLRRRKDSHSVS